MCTFKGPTPGPGTRFICLVQDPGRQSLMVAPLQSRSVWGCCCLHEPPTTQPAGHLPSVHVQSWSPASRPDHQSARRLHCWPARPEASTACPFSTWHPLVFT